MSNPEAPGSVPLSPPFRRVKDPFSRRTGHCPAKTPEEGRKHPEPEVQSLRHATPHGRTRARSGASAPPARTRGSPPGGGRCAFRSTTRVSSALACREGSPGGAHGQCPRPPGLSRPRYRGPRPISSRPSAAFPTQSTHRPPSRFPAGRRGRTDSTAPCHESRRGIRGRGTPSRRRGTCRSLPLPDCPRGR